MRKTTLSEIAKGLASSAKRYSPQILTGIGVVGMFATAIMAVKATPKALELIKERKLEKGDEELTPAETVKAAWKCYIPAAIMSAVSTACLVGANSVSGRRNALWATAYAASESALKTYHEKVIETIGEKKERVVRDAIAKDTIDRNPVSNRAVILTTTGNVLCYDVFNDRYFESDIELMRRAANNIDYSMLVETTATLNDFYYEIGLKPTKNGDKLGWNINDGRVECDFSAQLADDGRPCLVLGFSIEPRYDFERR